MKVAAEFIKSAEYKSALPTGKLLVYSVMGGAFVALGGLLSTVVAGSMPGIAEVSLSRIRSWASLAGKPGRY